MAAVYAVSSELKPKRSSWPQMEDFSQSDQTSRAPMDQWRTKRKPPPLLLYKEGEEEEEGSSSLSSFGAEVSAPLGHTPEGEGSTNQKVPVTNFSSGSRSSRAKERLVANVLLPAAETKRW